MTQIVGNMRWKITISRLSETKDQYGATKQTYTPVYTKLSAELVKQAGTLTSNNFLLYNTNVLVFKIWYRDVLNTDIVSFNNQDYKIVDMNEIGYHEGLQLTVSLKIM
jgi:hypothetical protein